ncbi:MAG: hypothetical protein Q8Q76_00030 [Methylotenera sp.]|nr:hypothetical protein [Methylotenera sp.]
MQNNIFCPGGSNSQTGSAVSLRYPNSVIHNSGETIADVEALIGSKPGPYVVPIWNSHQGEIPAAMYVWNLIEEAKVKIADIWGKQIEFWYVRKSSTPTECKVLGSVAVAETQCSEFFLTNGFELKKYPLTTAAFEGYRNGDELGGVLVAPGQGENEVGYEIINETTANPNNFTTFVKFSDAIDETIQSEFFLTGIAIRPLKVVLGEAEQSLFDNLFSEKSHINEVQKLIFVIKRSSKVGLLFEGQKLYSGDLLDAEELETSDIVVHEDAGKLSQLYSSELATLFQTNFTSLVDGDFVLHRGVNSCLFACPSLGLFTHGYEEETVEPVVRFYINKFFELIDNGVECTLDQKAFFEKHLQAWREKRSEFIEFKIVN